MTPSVQGWLDSRAAGVPAELMERVRVAAAECLGGEQGTTSANAQDARTASATAEGEASRSNAQIQGFLQVVREQLGQLRYRECSARTDALDLLAADALMTYALEFVASVQPEALDKYAVELMHMVGGA